MLPGLIFLQKYTPGQIQAARTISWTGATVVTVNGLRLEEPPNQDAGGGLNSTVRAGTIDLRTPLAPGATLDVQFLLGVQTADSYRFLIIVEPLA